MHADAVRQLETGGDKFGPIFVETNDMMSVKITEPTTVWAFGEEAASGGKPGTFTSTLANANFAGMIPIHLVYSTQNSIFSKVIEQVIERGFEGYWDTIWNRIVAFKRGEITKCGM